MQWLLIPPAEAVTYQTLENIRLICRGMAGLALGSTLQCIAIESCHAADVEQLT